MTTFATSEAFGRVPLSSDGRAPNPADYPEKPESSRSYWQKQHHDTIAAGCDSAPLPSDVDVVIIGSGITGAAVAYQLAKNEPNLSVAVLEARGFCSGATGRNGGHMCRPEAFDFRGLAKSLGLEDAVKVKHMWTRNRDLMLATVEELGIANDIDMRLGGTIEVFKTQEQLDDYLADHEAAERNGYLAEATIMSAEDTRKFLGLSDDCPVAGAAYLKKSGTLWPRKLVEEVFRGAQALMPGLSIHTYTPVTHVARAGNEARPTYSVATTRGVVRARAVFHATNAYVSHLVPSLGGENGVFGAKCHVMAIQPNKPLPDDAAATDTHLPPGLGYDAFWHWIAQVPSRGPFVYGYSWTTTLHDFDDTVTYPPAIPGRRGMYDFLEAAFPRHFGRIEPERDVTHDWTGIMGYTTKGTSFVGKATSDSPGEFISVGHNGEGMSRCFACAEFASDALLAYLRGDDSWTPPEWFPSCYRVNI